MSAEQWGVFSLWLVDQISEDVMRRDVLLNNLTRLELFSRTCFPEPNDQCAAEGLIFLQFYNFHVTTALNSFSTTGY